MKIKTIIGLITVATMLQTGVSAQTRFIEQESTITLNANGGYLGSGYMGTKTEIELETEKGKIKLPLPYRASDYDFIGWYTEDGEKVTSKTEYYEDTKLNAKWEQISNTVNTIGKDRIYMTDEEIEMRKEILERQYPPTFSISQITKLIQLLQELLKQTEVQQSTPQPTQTTTTYIDGFGYVPQGNTTQTIIGDSTGDINKIVANME